MTSSVDVPRPFRGAVTIPNVALQCALVPVAPPPVRPVTLEEIRAARERIRNVAIRTPLIKLRHDAPVPEIWLKLENLQPINAFKIRGAANAVALLSPEARKKGVWTISAGNAGQGVAFAAREAGIPCSAAVGASGNGVSGLGLKLHNHLA